MHASLLSHVVASCHSDVEKLLATLKILPVFEPALFLSPLVLVFCARSLESS